jgi:hypothetical protein
MKRVAVTAQGTDFKPVIVQDLLPLREFLLVVKHGQLAMRIARIVAGPEFDSVDVQGL